MRPRIGCHTNALLPVPIKARPRPAIRVSAHAQNLPDANGSNGSSKERRSSATDTLQSIDLLLGSADDGDQPCSAAKGNTPVPKDPVVSKPGDERSAGLTKTISTLAKGYVADKLKRPTARDLVSEEDADALTLVLLTPVLLMICIHAEYFVDTPKILVKGL